MPKRILGFDVSYEDGPSGEELLFSLVSTFLSTLPRRWGTQVIVSTARPLLQGKGLSLQGLTETELLDGNKLLSAGTSRHLGNNDVLFSRASVVTDDAFC